MAFAQTFSANDFIAASRARIGPMRDAAATLALFAVIGIELLVLVTWTPETLRVWFDPQTHGYGDFKVFFANAQSLSLTNMYSPGLAALMHPLTRLPMETAFAVYTGINVAALAGVAYIAQRAVSSLPAKVAVVLGVLALPQTHWAIRVGHFTQVLALAALCGLLLSDRRPVIAGVCIAVLALKPQYLPLPLLYLLVTHNWRAFGVATGGLTLLGVAGVLAMAVRDPAGIGMFVYTASYYADRAPELLRYVTVGQGDANYTQS
jgi:multidrug transporter EmrE-like cation transporter